MRAAGGVDAALAGRRRRSAGDPAWKSAGSTSGACMNRSDRLTVLGLMALGVVPKLAALPFAMTTEADAVSRVWIAWRWLGQPEWISHGVWGPLHTYMLAAALFVYPDPVVAPAILNVLLSTATAILLYLLVRDAFGRRAGGLVAAAYCFYPVAFRNSLMAVSEVPFTFFLVLSLWLLQRAERRAARVAGNASGWATALAAGLTLTLAGMLRYEAWAAIPLLGWQLRRRPVLLATFAAAALAFPAIWMIGNHVHHGDALYSVHRAAYLQIELGGYNEDLTLTGIVKRLVYYPAALGLGLTPPVALAALAGLAVGLRRRLPMPWVVPLLGLLAIFIVQALRGDLLLRGRYSIVLGTLLLPCAAALYAAVHPTAHGGGRRRPWLEIALIAAMLPSAYLGVQVAPRFLNSIFLYDILPVPRPDPATYRLAAAARAHLQGDQDAFVADFMGWRESYGIALETRLHPDRIWIAPERPGDDARALALIALVERYPNGLLLLRQGSPLARALEPASGGPLAGLAARLELQPIQSLDERGVALHRYALRAPP